MLLDNLRQNKKEKENNFYFAKSLASFADFYINDAFAVSHRKHSSVSKIINFFEEEKKAYGFQFKKN